MESHPISPLGPVKLAITMDDMLLFRGVPVPKSYSCLGSRPSSQSASARGRRPSRSRRFSGDRRTHVAEERVFRGPVSIAMAVCGPGPGTGMNPFSSTPEQLAALMKTDMAKWAKVIKAANIRIEN